MPEPHLVPKQNGPKQNPNHFRGLSSKGFSNSDNIYIYISFYVVCCLRLKKKWTDKFYDDDFVFSRPKKLKKQKTKKACFFFMSLNFQIQKIKNIMFFIWFSISRRKKVKSKIRLIRTPGQNLRKSYQNCIRIAIYTSMIREPVLIYVNVRNAVSAVQDRGWCPEQKSCKKTKLFCLCWVWKLKIIKEDKLFFLFSLFKCFLF